MTLPSGLGHHRAAGTGERQGDLVKTKPFIDEFEVWEDGKKVDDDDTPTISLTGAPLRALKAAGYKDKTFDVNGSDPKKKVVVAVGGASRRSFRCTR